jgi:hypothetical protein
MRALALLALLALPSPAIPQSVPDDTLTLATGRYAEMHMLLEKTIFKVDVLTMRLRFDTVTASRLATLVGDRALTRSLADSVARVALRTEDSWAVLEFVRGASLDQFLGGVRKDMRKAVDAGIISEADFRMIFRGMPRWYAFLADRRIREGDRMFYRLTADALRTVYLGMEGEILLDQTDVGRERPLAVLGSWFAPGSSFRKKLIESLFAASD